MNVLFLATRFPVPPWRGDQLRAYHHLRVLARRHRLTLAALVYRPPSPEERARLEQMGIRVEVIPLGALGAADAMYAPVVSRLHT